MAGIALSARLLLARKRAGTRRIFVRQLKVKTYNNLDIQESAPCVVADLLIIAASSPSYVSNSQRMFTFDGVAHVAVC